MQLLLFILLGVLLFVTTALAITVYVQRKRLREERNLRWLYDDLADLGEKGVTSTYSLAQHLDYIEQNDNYGENKMRQLVSLFCLRHQPSLPNIALVHEFLSDLQSEKIKQDFLERLSRKIGDYVFKDDSEEKIEEKMTEVALLLVQAEKENKTSCMTLLHNFLNNYKEGEWRDRQKKLFSNKLLKQRILATQH